MTTAGAPASDRRLQIPTQRLSSDAQTAKAARAEQAEARLSEFWHEHLASQQRLSRVALRRPLPIARAAGHMLALPQLTAELSNDGHGLMLRQHLLRRTVGWLTMAASGACVLEIPTQPDQYLEGARRQTLRRKIRAAQKHGITTEPVISLDEQRALAVTLTAAVRAKSDERYRQDDDQSYRVGQGPWTIARAKDGTPLVIAVTPYEGQWALLTCFISLGDSPQHSDARYLLTATVVERLRARGVRYLVDSNSPVEITNGLRHFQRMLGFRIARVRVQARPADPPPDRA